MQSIEVFLEIIFPHAGDDFTCESRYRHGAALRRLLAEPLGCDRRFWMAPPVHRCRVPLLFLQLTLRGLGSRERRGISSLCIYYRVLKFGRVGVRMHVGKQASDGGSGARSWLSFMAGRREVTRLPLLLVEPLTMAKRLSYVNYIFFQLVNARSLGSRAPLFASLSIYIHTRGERERCAGSNEHQRTDLLVTALIKLPARRLMLPR
jgi:hypothetical protein